MKMKARTAPPGMSMMRRKRARRMERPRRLRSMVTVLVVEAEVCLVCCGSWRWLLGVGW